MSTFKLPDLGEGLAEAEIVQWHVKPGDHVVVDQPMVSVETAKAVVEVPVPFSGTVTTLHGAAGDIIATGAPLIDLQPGPPVGTLRKAEAGTPAGAMPAADAGTVVGTMPVARDDAFSGAATLRPRAGGQVPDDGCDDGRGDSRDDSRRRAIGHGAIDPGATDPGAIGRDAADRGSLRTRALPIARALARRLSLDLSRIAGSGPDGAVTLDDVLRHAELATREHGAPRPAPDGARAHAALERGEAADVSVISARAHALAAAQGAVPEPLRGARRAMARSMSLSRAHVSGSTVCDDADIDTWTRRGDYLPRLIRALAAACAAEPALNAWYDPAANARTLLRHIDLAVAIDTPGGLIVPVLRDVGNKTPAELKAAVAKHKTAAHERNVAPADLRDFTLMVSNFGTLAGRYGVPLVVPPAVAILGAGKVRRDAVVVADPTSDAGAAQAVPDDGAASTGIVAAHWRMPLSLSFDHRCITGGEACRFLAAVIADLQKPD